MNVISSSTLLEKIIISGGLYQDSTLLSDGNVALVHGSTSLNRLALTIVDKTGKLVKNSFLIKQTNSAKGEILRYTQA